MALVKSGELAPHAQGPSEADPAELERLAQRRAAEAELTRRIEQALRADPSRFDNAISKEVGGGNRRVGRVRERLGIAPTVKPSDRWKLDLELLERLGQVDAQAFSAAAHTTAHAARARLKTLVRKNAARIERVRPEGGGRWVVAYTAMHLPLH